MMTKTLSSLALSAALLAAPAAHAAVDWGTHDTTESFNYSPSFLPDFTNSFSFSLSSASDVAAEFSLYGLIGSATVRLLDGTGSLLSSFSATTLGNGSASWSNLAAGDYTYDVAGGGFLAGGTFTSTATAVSAVPEPGSMAMLLAGLGMVGFIARRRRRI